MVNNRYVLSFSYGDYRTSIGGTDKVILAHQKMFNENLISYIYLFPLNLSNSRPVKKNRYWGVIEDGVFINVLHTTNVLNYISRINVQANCLCIHIHHMRNIFTKDLSSIVEFEDCAIYFYIHDYYNICISTNLIKKSADVICQDIMKEKTCSGCEYYEQSCIQRDAFLDMVNYFYLRSKIICPSSVAKEQFIKIYPQFTSITKVIYHQKLVGRRLFLRREREIIKVAYVGSQLNYKGWNQFLKIVSENKNNDQYVFYYFGEKSIEDERIKWIHVNFQSNLNAMVSALRKEEIDCVLLWSIWPETYSYTFYESLAAGCYVITNPNSGNIQAQVKKRNNGIILKTDNELYSLFSYARKLRCKINFCINETLEVPEELVENDEIVNFELKEFDVSRSSCQQIYKPKYKYTAIEKMHKVLYEFKISRK